MWLQDQQYGSIGLFLRQKPECETLGCRKAGNSNVKFLYLMRDDSIT